ncbi:MAG: T9SS type B sorting domain-containing protein [Bacteroidales bacterium]|jgi:gliding motility-associated-like protein|nr:T9SS type B sorting domain-containing protein [Bacteroidales bacterium]
MKYYIKILFVIIFFTFLHECLKGQPQSVCGEQTDFSWIKTAGGISSDEVKAISTDEDGNIYLTGYFSGELTFQSETVTSTGDKDVFLAKLDENGNLLWIRTGGSDRDDYGTGVAVDSEGYVYIVGVYNRIANFDGTILPFMINDNVFFIKYSPDGDIVWAKALGSGNDEIAGGICIDDDDNIIFTGYFKHTIEFEGEVIFSNGGINVFVAKFNTSGSLIWLKRYGNLQRDSYGLDIASDSDGNIFVTGEFINRIDFDPFHIISLGGSDIFIAKLNSSGEPQWLRGGGTNLDDVAGAVTTDENGNSHVCYRKNQSVNQGVIQKYNPGGTLVLNINFGNTGNVYPNDIIVDNNENIFITGMYEQNADFGDGAENSNGGPDYFLVKYLNDGTFSYKNFGGSPYSDSGNAIWIDNSGNIITGGMYQNNFVIESSNQTSRGNSDLMIIKYKKYFLFGDIIVSSINCDPNNMCIDVETIGGASPFIYNWSSGQTSEDICGIGTGIYTITVTDNTGCEIEKDVEVVALETPVINMPATVSACPFDMVTLDAGAGHFSYSWSTGENTQSIDVFDENTYYITVTDENSCSASASVVVSKLPNPSLFTVDPYYFCPKDFTDIQVPGYQQYLWSNGSVYSYLRVNREAEYWLRVFDGTCYYYDTIQLIKYPQADINLTSSRTTICENDSILITAAPGFPSYLWPDNSTSNTYWANESGNIYVTIIDQNGCRDSASINITHVPRPVVNLGNDTTVCSNLGYRLHPNNPYTNTSYLWNNATTDSTLVAGISGTYWVRATSNAGGCVEYDTISIVINPLPDIDLGDDINFCENDSVKLEIITNYPEILWSTGSTNNFIYVSETQEITVRVTDNNGCVGLDTIYMYENIVDYPFLGLDTTLCDGDVYTLSPKEEYYKYLWNTGSNLPYIEVREPGTYRVTVFDSYNCSNSASINIKYQSDPVILGVEVKPGGVFIYGDEGTPPYQYSLDEDMWQNENVFYNYPSGNYTASIRDKNHCKASIDFFLEAIYMIPSFFTPNADGYNDVWKLEGLYHFPNAVVKVFDRYGKEIYEFNASGDGWDGTYLGEPVPSDTYWYIIDLGISKEIIKGHVTIKR